MSIRDRLKGFVVEQGARVRGRLGNFNVRTSTGPMAPPPPGRAAASPAPAPDPTADPAASARRVIRAPLLVDTPRPAGPPGEEVLIKAQASRDGGSCTLMLDRPVIADASWVFSSPATSGVAAAILDMATLTEVIVDHDTVTLVGKPGDEGWRGVAAEAAQRVREALACGEPLLTEEQLASIPPEEVVREQIQQALDAVVNPGVAAHSGHVSLDRVRGNSVWITMGGGCQGCSAADLTLRQGIYTTFREAVVGLGAIYDATDHAAGTNPHFS